MNKNQKRADQIRTEISKHQNIIDDLQDELYGVEDYKCVIPKAYNSLTDFLNNHKANEQYAICDNDDAAEEILSNKAHKDTKHIILLSDAEIEEVKLNFNVRSLNMDWERFHPERYTGSSKLKASSIFLTIEP